VQLSGTDKHRHRHKGEKQRMKANQRNKTARSRPATDTDTIVERISAAIVERRLPPGTKLKEEHLGNIFGVSRTKIREALFRLAGEKLVTLSPGRGALVAQPSVREARDVFEARKMLECAIVDKFARVATAEQIECLRKQIACEQKALASDNLQTGTPGGTRFLGEFHFLIADLLGNQVVAELLRELASRTSLIEVLYESSMTPACSAQEHLDLLATVENRDAAAAVALMAAHLEHIESCLHLKESEEQAVDLVAVLA